MSLTTIAKTDMKNKKCRVDEILWLNGSDQVRNKPGFGVIYRVVELTSGRSYIGQCADPKGPRARICRSLGIKNSSQGCMFFKYMSDAGLKNFAVSVLWTDVPISDLSPLEDLMIQLCDSRVPTGFNVRRGGGGGYPIVYLWDVPGYGQVEAFGNELIRKFPELRLNSKELTLLKRGEISEYKGLRCLSRVGEIRP